MQVDTNRPQRDLRIGRTICQRRTRTAPNGRGMRRSTNQQPQKEMEGLMWMMGKLLLRHEDQQSIDKSENNYIAFFKHESKMTLVSMFHKESGHWHELKEQKQEELSLPLRASLFRSMLDSLHHRLTEITRSTKQLELADLSAKEGWRGAADTTSTLEPRAHRQPLTISKMLETISTMQQLCIAPQVILRFHSTQRLNAELRRPTLPFLLQVGHCTHASKDLYPALQKLEERHLAAGRGLTPGRANGQICLGERTGQATAALPPTACLQNRLSLLC